MTDARFPERYLSDRRVLRLEPDVFRGWVLATAWSVSNRTDGIVQDDDLPLLPFMPENGPMTLVERGLWTQTEKGWRIEDFAQTQTSKHELEVLDNARRREREKKARQRATKTGATVSFGDVPGDGPGGSSRGTSRGRVPEDSTGRTGRDEGKWFDDETGEITGPAPSIPAGWGSRSCVVCGTSIPTDSPVPWCPKQDDEHNHYRSAAAA